MKNLLVVLVFLSVILLDCNRKQYICPAYNTYFIHDDKERHNMFLPFKIDSLNEETKISDNRLSTDSTTITFNPDNIKTSKYHPKDYSKDGKKSQPNGLVINASGKKKMRNITDIEMKTIMAKPIAQYSNVDSSSLAIPDSMYLAPHDTM
jgi:hypothetical protein